MFSVRPQIRSSVKKFLRLLQSRVQATHLFLEDDDLGRGAPGPSDDLEWGGETTRDAQGCGGAPHPWDYLRGILGDNTVTTPQTHCAHKLTIVGLIVGQVNLEVVYRLKRIGSAVPGVAAPLHERSMLLGTCWVVALI